jgi:hypothetical protein
VLVLARDGAGAEMFGEARLALEYGIPTVWFGTRRPLSAYRPGVVRVETIDEAMEQLAAFAQITRRLSLVSADDARDAIWMTIEDVDDMRAAQ